MISPSSETNEQRPRQRLSRDERRRQLLGVAWQLVREEGTEALTLGRVAEKSGITKPVVYDHFATRSGLLAALYRDYDARQNAAMDTSLATGETSLERIAGAIASSYVNCVLSQGREIPGVIAALTGSPEMEEIKREYEAAFIAKCRTALVPFTRDGVLAPPALWAMLGAAEALSHAATIGEITATQAQDELMEMILAMVSRTYQESP